MFLFHTCHPTLLFALPIGKRELVFTMFNRKLQKIILLLKFLMLSREILKDLLPIASKICPLSNLSTPRGEWRDGFLKRPFRFESMWVEDPRSYLVVQHSWLSRQHHQPPAQFVQRQAVTRMAIWQWNHHQFGQVQTVIKCTREAISAILDQPVTNERVAREANLRLTLDAYLKHEETLWLNKSKLKWRREGDRYTKIFFMTTMLRRKRNRIDAIKDDNGVWLQFQDQIGRAFLAKFQSIYSNDTTPSDLDLTQWVNNSISEEHNVFLVVIPDHEKIRRVMFNMGNYKALRPNGMTSLFYKSYWQIVITKLLVDRIKPLLQDLICPTQGAFISGRSIHDTSIIIQEVIHSMKKKSGQEGYVAMKIDLQKAYDRLNWKFLFAVLKAFGFHDRWIGWVRSCVSSVSMNLLLNGSVFGSFRPKRGLRQGDPLSPYLFILCIDMLSRLISHKVDRGLIHGLKVSQGALAIHHLLFADDIFLLGKASTWECSQFKKCLDIFCNWSGQSFNVQKSNIFFSKNTRLAVASALTRLMGFSRISLQSHYLGLPLFRSNRVKDFSYLLDCLDNNLASWKMKLLSRASRLILIKSVALALPIYSMQSSRLPKSICSKMDSKVRQFWWGSRSDSSRALCLRSWSAICAPKALGGLGFRRFDDMNKTLLCKWGWDIIFSRGSLCLSLLRAKYLRLSDFLASHSAASDSNFWKGVTSCLSLLVKGSCRQIGDGYSTRIWDDPWILTTDSFRVSTTGAASFGLFMVSYLILPSREWDERKIRCCFNLVDAESILKIPLPIQPRPDRWVWTFTKNGKFSAKSAYLFDQHQCFFESIYHA
ncbi:hypothetical protein UlMin_040619 [Ulmus minor]